MIQELKGQHKQDYQNNRIPLLVYVQEELNYSDYRRFRDYYYLYKTDPKDIPP